MDSLTGVGVFNILIVSRLGRVPSVVLIEPEENQRDRFSENLEYGPGGPL